MYIDGERGCINERQEFTSSISKLHEFVKRYSKLPDIGITSHYLNYLNL